VCAGLLAVSVTGVLDVVDEPLSKLNVLALLGIMNRLTESRKGVHVALASMVSLFVAQ
jgi:hypothetical protein